MLIYIQFDCVECMNTLTDWFVYKTLTTPCEWGAERDTCPVLVCDCGPFLHQALLCLCPLLVPYCAIYLSQWLWVKKFLILYFNFVLLVITLLLLFLWVITINSNHFVIAIKYCYHFKFKIKDYSLEKILF